MSRHGGPQGGVAHVVLGVLGCGAQAHMGDRLAQGISVPRHPVAAMARGPANAYCPWDRECWGQWGAQHPPLSSVPSWPRGLAVTLLYPGCGEERPRWAGASLSGYCRLGRRPERGIVLSLPGLLGMLVFWVIKQL